MMINLRQHIEESLFGGKSDDEIAGGVEHQAQIKALQEIAYDNINKYARTSTPWECGSVSVGEKGYVVYLRDPKKKAPKEVPELTLTFRKRKLPLPFETICLSEKRSYSLSGTLSMEGTLYITDYPGKDLTELFTPDCKIQVSAVWIVNCDNLVSLKGFPKDTVTNVFCLRRCEKLKDCSDLPPVPYVQTYMVPIGDKSFKNISKETKAAVKDVNITFGHVFKDNDVKQAVLQTQFGPDCYVRK